MRCAAWRWTSLLGVLILLAIIAPVESAPPATRPTSAPTTRLVRRRVLILPSTQRATAPMPQKVTQEQLQTKIREIYATDYLDTSFLGRRALAKRLIDASEETHHDTDAKFVFLNEARDVASSAGDVTTAFDAIDALTRSFPLSKLTERVEVLKAVVPTLSSIPANLAAASISMDLVEQCMIEGDYDRAQILLSLATACARQGKSVTYAKWINARSAAIGQLKEAYENARPAEAELALTPDDPTANLVMGKFVAFIKGDSDSGLAMLEKGADNALAEAAGLDLDNPQSPSEQFKLAGLWWNLVDVQRPEYRTLMLQRSGFWYRKAVQSLDGLDKALAERRLQELNPPIKAGTVINRAYPPDALLLMPRRWYRVSIAEVKWAAAQRLCAEGGGQLVSVETRAEGDLINKLARGRPLWLGAGVDESGRWKWLSGPDLLYTNWASGEPRNLSNESHPMIGKSGNWQTSTNKAGFICEWRE